MIWVGVNSPHTAVPILLVHFSKQVHLELAKYHEICRFTDDGTYDKSTALFHLTAAADCGVVDAIVNVAKIYCGLPHDILAEVVADDEADAAELDDKRPVLEKGL